MSFTKVIDSNVRNIRSFYQMLTGIDRVFENPSGYGFRKWYGISFNGDVKQVTGGNADQKTNEEQKVVIHVATKGA